VRIDVSAGRTDEPADARPRGVLKALLVAALGLGAMAASAALAWSIRARVERQPDRAVPTAGSDESSRSPTAAKGLPALLRRGRLTYQVHCARCHGPEGRGDGADAPLLQPPPRDFAAAPWTHGQTPESVREAVRRGIAGTAMPGFGPLLSKRELEGVVAFVRTLACRPEAAAERRPSLDSLLRRARFEPAGPASEEPIAAVAFHDLDGRRRTLGSFRGKAVLLAFWGTSCAPCLSELPALERLAREFAADGLDVVALCVDETSPEPVRSSARGRVEELPLYVDATGLARLRFDVQVLPSTVLIDRSGRPLGRAQGTDDWSRPELRELLRAVLKANEPG
jgi:mono/diheme cytochrome c family protein/thiol-disulfide isomerase/thioredoxin